MVNSQHFKKYLYLLVIQKLETNQTTEVFNFPSYYEEAVYLQTRVVLLGRKRRWHFM